DRSLAPARALAVTTVAPFGTRTSTRTPARLHLAVAHRLDLGLVIGIVQHDVSPFGSHPCRRPPAPNLTARSANLNRRRLTRNKCPATTSQDHRVQQRAGDPARR